MSREQQLAEALRAAQQKGGHVPRAQADFMESIAQAYAVQRLVSEGYALPRAGWKVGATSAEPQRLLGMNEPATAPMFGPYCLPTGAEVPVFPGQSASVEGEFAFIFAKGLPPRAEGYTLADVVDAVGAMAPAIEVVGCRFEGGFERLGAFRLVADSTAHTAFVSGPATDSWRDTDLRAHAVTMRRNGEPVYRGTGANVLDGPLSVLVWTANHLSAMGESINAGEVVTTGTCTGITAVRAGDTAAADFGPLGRVELRITAP